MFLSRSTCLVFVGCTLVACGTDRAAADRHGQSAGVLLERQQYELAMLEIRAALAIDPRHQRARSLKARILLDTARLEEAEEVLAGLRDDYPGKHEFRSELAHVLKAQGRHRDALTMFASLPFSRTEILPTAECMLVLGQFRAAASLTAKLLASNPWQQNAYLLLAKIEAQRGERKTWAKIWGNSYRRMQQARETNTLGIDLESQGRAAEAALQFGRSLYRSGRLFEATLRINKALELDPNLAPAYLTLGRIMMDTGRSKNAVAAIGRALSLQPGKQNWQKRLAEARAMASADKDQKKTVFELAQQHAADGQHDKARVCALFAAQRSPGNVEARRLVGEYFNRPEDAFVRLWAWRAAGDPASRPAQFRDSIRKELQLLAVDFGPDQP